MPSPEEASDAEARALDHAQDVLWGHAEGVLRFDEQNVPLRFIHDPASGRLISSVPVAILMATEHVLFLPDESDDALQLLVSPEETEEGAATDRWQAYHGEPEHVRWGAFWIDGARHGPWIFDGDAIAGPNPLAREEAALCRLANADRERLAGLCQRCAGVQVPDAVCVGVDARGIHVRARFGIVRVRFTDEGVEVPDAAATLRAMLEAGAP